MKARGALASFLALAVTGKCTNTLNKLPKMTVLLTKMGPAKERKGQRERERERERGGWRKIERG